MIRLILAAIAACLLVSPAIAHDGVHVEGAYAVVVTPNAPTAAVYFTIENHAMEEDRLIAATTDAAKRTMLHRSMETDGVMTMAPVEEGFPIDGMGSFALERGGAHIMLLGLTKSLADGDTITLTLTFERSGVVVVEVPVNPKDAADEDHSDHVMPAN